MPVFKPLSSSETSLAHHLINQPDLDDNLVAPDLQTQLTGKSLKSLRRRQWLTDEVINAYLLLIQSEFPRVFVFSSFFWQKLTANGYDYESVANWNRRRKVTLWESDIALIPINVRGNHWALGAIDFRDNSIAYYDSLRENGLPQKFKPNLIKYLTDHGRSSDKPARRWRFYYPHNLRQQKNDNDCGVFLCLNAVYLANNLPPQSCSIAELESMRLRMLVQLCTGTMK